MANSKVQYTADGSTQSFAVTFPFISRTHVNVKVDGVSSTFTWDSDSQITISSPSLSGSEVVLIIRTTSQATRLIDYVDGSNLSESDLDTDSKQAFFMAQESLDVLSTIDDAALATNTHILVADGTSFTNVAMSGDATLANTGAITIANGSIDLDYMAADSVDGSKIVDDAIDSEHYTDGSIDLAHMSADSVDGSKIVDDAIDSEHYTDGSIDSAHIGDDQIVTAKILDGDVTLAKLVDATATNKGMGRVATGSGDWEEVTLQTTLSSSDEVIPTSKAVRDDIVSIVNDVGGFHAVADDQSFPNTNPDPDDGAGTVVSIANAGGLVVNGSGVSTTGRTLGASTVTINGIPATYQSTTIADSLGMHVISTVTLNTYNYHKMIAKEGDTNIVSTNIADVNTVAGISSNVTTVAGISSDVTAVAGDASDIGAVAAKATEIGRLGTADAVADMAILGTADVVTDLNTLGTADIVTDMNTLGTAGNVTAMATCATNVADINRYSDEYTIAASAPGSPSEGDLWYDSSNNVLKVHNGSSFVAVTSATAGITDVVDDTTPQLGGNLDMNGNNVGGVTPTEMGYVSGITSALQTQLDAKQATIANDGLSGDKINGGTISNFASTGISDNATSTAITITADEGVGIGASPSADTLLHCYGYSGNISTSDNVAEFEAAIGSYTGSSIVASNTIGPSSTYSLIKCITDSDGDGGGPHVHLDVKGDGTMYSSMTATAPASGGYVDGSEQGAAGTFHLTDTSSYVINTGPAIMFRAERSAGGLRMLAGIAGRTEGSDSGYLQFLTRSDTVYATERMRITSGGNVGIGTTAPTRLLHVASKGASTTPFSIFNSTGNYDDLRVAMQGDNRPWLQMYQTDGAGGGTEKIRLDVGGDSFVTNKFTAGTFVGEGAINGWCTFNGTGTIAILDSFNVTSLTDSGTGLYSVLWDTDFTDADYCVSAQIKDTSGGEERVTVGSLAGGSAYVKAWQSGAYSDKSQVFVIGIGDSV